MLCRASADHSALDIRLPTHPNPLGHPKGVDRWTSTATSVFALGSLQTGVWCRLQELAARNPVLGKTLDGIRQSVVNSKAKSTAKIYQKWFEKFCQFCSDLGVVREQIGQAEVILYVQDLMDRGRAPSSIGQAISAIAWYFQVADRQDPTKHRLVADLVSVARRTGPEVQHKEPATHKHLFCLQRYSQQKRTFVAARTYIIALTLYAGCSRLNDVLKLPRSAVTMGKEKVKLFIAKSKTDQTKKGLKKSMYKAVHTTLCPVAAYEDWFGRKEVGKRGAHALFPVQRDCKKPVSETTFKENLQTALAESGLVRISSHSHRAGAATDAAQNSATIDQLQLLGGWRDPRSVGAYVRRSEAGRAEASKTLHL